MVAALKPFFSYYGGKYRAAPRYPPPVHDVVIEPFAGSAGYSVRHHARKVVLRDANEKVCGVWDYLIRSPAADVLALPLDVEDVRDLKVCQEAKWLIGFWLNKGCSSPRNCPSSRMLSGFRPHSHWGEVIRERLASQVDQIRHWEVRCAAYLQTPDVEATWFVDPPYANAAGEHYATHFTNHAALGDWCRSRKGQVIVCEGPGADWLPFESMGVLKSMTRFKDDGTSGYSEEFVWLGGDRSRRPATLTQASLFE